MIKKILIASIVLGGLYQLKPELFERFIGPEGAYHDDGTPMAILFVSEECGKPCDDAINHIDRKGVEAEIIDIKSSDEAMKRFRDFSRANTIPVLAVAERIETGYHPKRFDEDLMVVAGTSILSSDLKKALRTHFNEDGSPKVIVYGTDWCPYTTKAREFLTDHNIEYDYFNVDSDWQAKQHYSTLEASGYPLIYVGSERVGGYNKHAVLDAVEKYLD